MFLPEGLGKGGFLEEVTSTLNQRRQEECDRWQVGEGTLAGRGTWIEAPRASHVSKVKILALKVGL